MRDGEVTLYINHPIPPIDQWSSEYGLPGNDNPLKFTKIIPKKWITERTIALDCDASFYYFDDSDLHEGEKKLAPVIPLRRRDGKDDG